MKDLSVSFARRDVLRLALQAVAGATAGCERSHGPDTLTSTPIDIPTSSTGIDVHCHMFNARDLPIPGFVLHVVLEEDPAASLQFGFLVTLLALILDQGARGADTEIAALGTVGQGLCSAPASSSQMSAAHATTLHKHVAEAVRIFQSPQVDARSQEVIDQSHKVLSKRAAHKTTLAATENLTGAAARPGGTSNTANANRQAFLGRLALLQPAENVPGLAAHPNQVAPANAPAAIFPHDATGDQTADAVAKGVVLHARNKSGVFYMASLLTRPRAELALDLAALPQPADRTEIALFTPALVDFSYWLAENANDANDATPTKMPSGTTPLAQQIDVMSDIASKSCASGGIGGGFAVHPFVSFCPWRQIAEELSNPKPTPTQWDLVQQAIESKGFVGIKLYPLMGFRPTGNVGVDPTIYPARLRLLDQFAARLDQALETLYLWCIRNDVPIMAHCSYSQYPSQLGGLLGGPNGWFEMLDNPRFNKLRLNIAHCGGVWDLAANKRKEVVQKSGGRIVDPWAVTVIEKIGSLKYPNLYADLADFSDVLSCSNALSPPAIEPTGGDQSAVTALARLVAQNPQVRQRLMYGTDYMFLILSKGTENYVAQMRGCVAKLLQIDQADLMGRNAAHFLGLTDPDSLTVSRLKTFRKDNFLDRWLPRRV